MTAITDDTHDHEVGEVVTNSHEAHDTPAYDDLNTPMIALVGFVSAILTFVCIFGLQAAYLQYAQGIQQKKVVDVRLEEVESVLDAQQAKLNTNYQWIDRGAEKIQVPIERAMQIVVEKYQSE